MRIKKRLITGKFILSVITALDKLVAWIAKKIYYSRGQIQCNKVFFMTYDDGFTCNPSYIAQELIRRKAPVEIVWAGRPNADFPKEIRVVPRGSFEMFEEMSSAKVWVDNALNGVWYDMPKKKGQVYINTWHGSMGIKKLHGNRNWMMHARRCKKLTDYCIANSAFEENVYRETFWPDTPILQYGHARNDVFFEKETAVQTREKVCSILGIEAGRKVCLYAPTFRDNGNTACFNMDFARLKDALEQWFGGEWTILVRYHYKNRKQLPAMHAGDWLKDASDYADMQELMIAADMGISDYSSWVYDYILSRKPVLIYAPDLDDYDQQRGFYYPLESTPFPIARSNDEIAACLNRFDETEYKNRVECFLKEKGCYETGRASSLAADKILEVMGIKGE